MATQWRKELKVYAVVGVVAFLGTHLWTWAHEPRNPQVKIGYAYLPRLAVHRVMPMYPDYSVQRHSQGLAMIVVHIDEAGKVVSADITKAPDPLIGDAVKAAVQQWLFTPTTLRAKAAAGQSPEDVANAPRTPAEVYGKLLFKFSIENGVGHVSLIDSKETPLNSGV